jgi:starch synthase (maltosyl-transferring)
MQFAMSAIESTSVPQPPGSRPVRIAFCITELDAGGAERALTQIVCRLDRREWEPRVYCLGPPGVFASVLQDEGIPVDCFHAVHLWDAPRVLWQLTRELRRWRPELLQTFLFHANILGRIAGRLAGVKHVVCGQRVAERRSSWYGRIDRWTSGLVERHVCVSQGVANYCEHLVGLPASKLLVIPNAVEATKFSSALPVDWRASGVPADQQVLITIARLEPQKGVDVLLEAFSEVAPRCAAAHLVVVGDGPDRAKLEATAQQGTLRGRVTFVGRRDDVPRLLAGSCALILASRWEGMPNAVLEAMAAAKPVIATQVEGANELVATGHTGWLVPPGNSKALAAAMLELLENLPRAAEMGRMAQRIVSQQFTIDSMAAAYCRLYRQLLHD